MRKLIFFMLMTAFFCSSHLVMAQNAKQAEPTNNTEPKETVNVPDTPDEQLSYAEWNIDKLSKEIASKVKEVNQALSEPKKFDEASFVKTYSELKGLTSRKYDAQLQYILLKKKMKPDWTPSFKGGVWKLNENAKNVPQTKEITDKKDKATGKKQGKSDKPKQEQQKK